MTKIYRPHDKFVRKILGNKELAHDFLMNYVPENVRKLIEPDEIRIAKDKFIEMARKDYESDLLYEVRLVNEPAYVYFLFEHKSYPEKKTVLKLLNYMVKIWELHWNQNSDEEPLPVIIPILIYHGAAEWKFGDDLYGFINCPAEELRAYVPDFRYILDDLTILPEEEIKGRELLQAAIMMLKYLKQPDFLPRLIKILHLLKAALDKNPDEDWFYIFIQYIFEIRNDVEPEKLKKLVEDNISASKGGELMTIAEKLRKEGRKEGRREGGVKIAKENIIDVLEVKFGLVPSHIAEKINAADDLAFLKSLLKKSILISGLDEIEKMLE